MTITDEMGMGKTVELLACIFAHRKSADEDNMIVDSESQATEDLKVNLKRLKRERVECICGAVSENRSYKGLWVQCDVCDAWQHADCVGYSEASNGKECGKSSVFNKYIRKKNTTTIVVRDGKYICQLCSELINATNSPIATGATLIICPAPILPQWHAEIMRYILFFNHLAFANLSTLKDWIKVYFYVKLVSLNCNLSQKNKAVKLYKNLVSYPSVSLDSLRYNNDCIH